MKRSQWHHCPVTLLGIDLAWGERNPDGVALLRFPGGVSEPPESSEIMLIQVEEALLEYIENQIATELVFIAIDAPTIGPNQTGSRPVDRECSRRFHREEAGCHPVNRKLCERPLRIAESLKERGYQLSSDLRLGPRLLAEVYPHPAMVRFFGIPKTIKYKRGPVANRRAEFSRYQNFTRRLLTSEFEALIKTAEIEALLSAKWNKGIEDQLDALFCSLIGWWHIRHLGEKSQQLGDESSGTILLPNPETIPLATT